MYEHTHIPEKVTNSESGTNALGNTYVINSAYLVPYIVQSHGITKCILLVRISNSMVLSAIWD